GWPIAPDGQLHGVPMRQCWVVRTLVWQGLLAALLLFIALPVLATEIGGRVVGITDGDTLTVLTDRQQTKVRLAEIDTPESGQPYGSRARQALSDLAFGKTV